MKATAQPLIFGEVLFDRFPDGREVLGGAPFNVAWNLQGIGFEPLLISAVGDDDRGHRVLAAVESWGMDRSGVQVNPSLETGIVNVSLKDGEPSFEIVANRAWDEISSDRLPALREIGLVYHGSLALRQQSSRCTLEKLLRRVRAPIMVDVNLRSPWWNREQVLSLLSAARMVKMNETELHALAPVGETLRERAMGLIERYRPDLFCVTRGAEGAVAYNGTQMLQVTPPEQAAPVVDTVGAGDAFAAVIVAGHLSEWPMELTLSRARELASEVVGLRGAVTEDAAFYCRLRKEWKLA